MKALPFFFCLIACAFAMHTMRAVATVDPSTESAADHACATRPTLCGFL